MKGVEFHLYRRFRLDLLRGTGQYLEPIFSRPNVHTTTPNPTFTATFILSLAGHLAVPGAHFQQP